MPIDELKRLCHGDHKLWYIGETSACCGGGRSCWRYGMLTRLSCIVAEFRGNKAKEEHKSVHHVLVISLILLFLVTLNVGVAS